MAKRSRTNSSSAQAEPFWKTTRLDDLTGEQWEALCDGCGKCCLYKIKDDEGRISFTSVACRLLDPVTCRCSNYARRHKRVPDCLSLDVKTVRRIPWLPSTCAYRLLVSGQDLPPWHPLISGDPETVHQAGASVRDRTVPEDEARRLEDFVIDWIS